MLLVILRKQNSFSFNNLIANILVFLVTLQVDQELKLNVIIYPVFNSYKNSHCILAFFIHQVHNLVCCLEFCISFDFNVVQTNWQIFKLNYPFFVSLLFRWLHFEVFLHVFFVLKFSDFIWIVSKESKSSTMFLYLWLFALCGYSGPWSRCSSLLWSSCKGRSGSLMILNVHGINTRSRHLVSPFIWR